MIGKTPEQQSVQAKKAEYRRPFHGESLIKDQGLSSMHRERADKMLVDLELLARNNVAFSPFLEIGAGSVQRSAALLNNYQAHGAAIDISFNSLRDAPYILSLLGYDRTPLLVCCDAHHLPFLPASFNFVFGYQTLHHFDNPVPVTREIYRVTGKGGHIFFNEEPMDSEFRRLLRGNRMLSHPPTKIQKIGYQLGVEKLFWDDGALERSLGMTEARFDADLWRKVLEPFVIVDMQVNRRLKIRTNLKKSTIHSSLSGYIGGNVRVLCRKTDGEAPPADFRQRLMCLDCFSASFSTETSTQLLCLTCGREYPIQDRIIQMFPKELDAALRS